MRPYFRIVLLFFVFLYSGFYSSLLQAQEKVSLSLAPTQCVTLREGQPCYVDLQIRWAFSNAIDVCLFSSQEPLQHLMCWTDVDHGSVELPQTLDGDATYRLQLKDGSIVAKADITVSWVYRKKRSQRRWRLF